MKERFSPSLRGAVSWFYSFVPHLRRVFPSEGIRRARALASAKPWTRETPRWVGVAPLCGVASAPLALSGLTSQGAQGSGQPCGRVALRPKRRLHCAEIKAPSLGLRGQASFSPRSAPVSSARWPPASLPACPVRCSHPARCCSARGARARPAASVPRFPRRRLSRSTRLRSPGLSLSPHSPAPFALFYSRHH